MAIPTSITVTTDSPEYSRYEKSLDTINVAVSAVGGSPYSGEPITVDLIKARRARDAVVATRSLELDGNDDPQELSASFFLPDLVDSDLISLIRHGKYFIKAYVPAISSTATIGSGANGSVYIAARDAGVDGDLLSVEVVAGAGTSALLVTQAGSLITVTLATVGGVPTASANTAQLIAARINANSSTIYALASGTGEDPLSAAAAVALTGGSDEVSATTDDFDIRIVSVARLKKDYLFGIPLKATSIKMPKSQPATITGVEISEVDPAHAEGFGSLAYSYLRDPLTNATLDIGSGANGTVTIEGIESRL